METLFTADPHFGHARIIELADRPFGSVEEMNEAIVENFNAACAGKRLVILGDICMGKLEESLEVLARIEAAQVILIPGNHDRWSFAYHHKGDEAAQRERREQFMYRYEVKDNFTTFRDEDTSGWRGWELGYERKHPLGKVWFSHYPYDGDSHGEDRHGHLRVPKGKHPIIHGHVHGEWRVKGKQFNVGVDVNDFKPVHEEELASWVSSL